MCLLFYKVADGAIRQIFQHQLMRQRIENIVEAAIVHHHLALLLMLGKRRGQALVTATYNVSLGKKKALFSNINPTDFPGEFIHTPYDLKNGCEGNCYGKSTVSYMKKLLRICKQLNIRLHFYFQTPGLAFHTNKAKRTGSSRQGA